MHGIKRLCYLLLCMIVALGMIAGCAIGGDDDSSDDDDDDNNDSGDDDTGDDDTGDDDTGDDDTGDDDTGDDDDDVQQETDQYGISWILVPEGMFGMGCSTNDDNCDQDETPWHQVTISPFKLMATEFTEKNYMQLMGETYNQGNVDNCGVDCPLFSIKWSVAADICYQAGGRLPTEAEWEYAARAGTTTMYYCGNDPECLDDIAWYYYNQQGNGHQPSSGKEPNAWGFYDILGTLMEWTADWYQEDYYHNTPDTDPRGPSAGEKRVMRGGDWASLPVNMRVSNRSGIDPKRGYYNFGFRCAKDE